MFKSLKLYTHQTINLEELTAALIAFGYQRQEQVSQEGDFSRRGEILDVYPATFDCPIRIALDINTIESITSIDLIHNRVIFSHSLVIILPKHKSYRSQNTGFTQESPLNLFVELKKGDLLVHIQHGIGRYMGIEKVKTLKATSDHFVLEYAHKEKLFVPVTEAHRIQKFIGLKAHVPKLNRLGTNEWEAVKRRVQKGIKTVAVGLLRRQAERAVTLGFSFSKDTDWQERFEKTFPYQETPDQIKAALEVKNDMESPHPMDRLLCGDVGYGKTEVALRAAFKAVMDNKQVAVLVPTTILAEQHYQNFIRRLKDFPVNVQMLSRFRSDAQQKKIVEETKKGNVDIIIGTHRLLSDDLAFKDLGLLIIDEEQRFGVAAKEKLKSMKLAVDVLTLTATPIPRTLYMGLMGLKDISSINTPPQNRIPITTYVVEYDDDIISHALTKELSRKGQVFFVHNQIYDIEEMGQRIKKLATRNAIVTCAHGQMPEKELEAIMVGFLEQKIDCLVSTTIIASGIDVPMANTLLVNNAHLFGLSDLHQLRGRVGRFDRKAYAYFFIPKDEILSSESRRRLEALKDYSELGAGFKIAMEDLEIRGAGNLLGYTQHGFIQAVGFDLYCRLLKEMVNVLKKGNDTRVDEDNEE
ncbi:MAG: transcription-repair coupling factor [Omnitrophica WOR_2 bacterium GWF2_43_52]|nr:MAG: transcription-repair coupling factor [Omnitrophica WOR_2 bacterium GWA2_44_7]OGX21156.1 MAG: transcription-repair coupling factor [Omnitrophica WOR_2 bacterium GWF2_43_52]OGX54017.1 MAG: transcription-repair coupling factor [Omnitrophica WOR_2 bacterium RIFOXYC2_FULL_43_9]HAH20334.1 transcription-repair coupling factor [Candidatus Omnitrophota bacterium]HBG62893.1 transcription-repair coupling factor [Candidatus Omnitrophota bacterium]